MTSSYADMGLFRLQGKVYFSSDILEMKKTLKELKKCRSGKLFVESYLGKDISKITDDDPKTLIHLIRYQKLNHYSVVNSSLEMESAARLLFKKCFSDYSKEAMAISLSEYYLQKIVKDLGKIKQMHTDLDKVYSHDLLKRKSNPSLWKKK